MRPLALAAILAALAGCSIPYEGKTFSAIEKPQHMAEGETKKVSEHSGEEGSAPAHEEGHSPETNSNIERPVASNSGPTSSAFPTTAQPTGRPPEMEAAPSEAGPNAEPVH